MSGYIHINRPSSTRFQARVRRPGHRLYTLVGPHTKDSQRAVLALARAMCSDTYKRGDVVMTADYYDPVQIIEMVRR